MRIAYLTSRVPKLSETFIANEAVAVRRAGADVRIYAYVEERTAVRHPAATELVADMVTPDWRRVLVDQLHWMRRSPRRYARAWWRAVAGNVRSPRFLARAVLVVPIAASFARTMTDDQVDHVHAHYATHSALGAYVIHLLTQLPYSFTAHAHDIQVDQTMLLEKIEHAAFVAAISEFNVASLVRAGGDPEALHVVRCGVDTSRFTPRPTTLDAPERTPFRIVIVASLERRKGHRILFEAVRRVVDEGVDVVVDVVGDGPDAADVARDVERLDLGVRVRLLGGLPSPDVVRVLHRADAFVLPSLTQPDGKMEGIPVALMEAMAVGLPVVATDMSGIPELVIDGSTGLLVAEGSVDELAAAVCTLVGSPGRASVLATAGAAHVRDEFDDRRNAERLYDLMQRAPRAASGST